MAEALAIAAAAVSTVGTLAGAGSQAAAAESEGKAQKAMAEYQARQLRYKAGQERASSQKQAINERRRARLAGSRARAVAAASGGGASDPTVMDILATLRGEGEYNAQSALYEGEESARGLEAQASAAEASGDYASAAAAYRAKATRRAGYMSAAGNLLSSGASFYSKYWPEQEATTMADTYNIGEITGGPGRTRRNWG